MIPNIELEDEYIRDIDGTSDGSQIKYYKDGVWYKVDYFGGEGIAEKLASLLLECSSLSKDKFIHYESIKINGKDGCLSPNYLAYGESFISLYRLYQNTKGGDIAQLLATMDYDDAIEYTIEFVKEKTNLDIREYLANIFYLDMIILNEDRHFNNLNLIFDGQSFRTAPIFDNGKSLLVGNKNYSSDKALDENIKCTYSKSFSGDFGLNYEYLKNYCTLSFDKKKLIYLLDRESASLQKEVLKFQAERIV